MPRALSAGDLTFIYAIGATDGPQKVGHAVSPRNRVLNFSTGNDRNLAVNFECAVPRSDVWPIERLLHHRLRDKRLRGEWFSLTPQEAAEAIRSGVEAYWRGERCPSKESSPPSAAAEPMTRRVATILPKASVLAVNEWRRHHPDLPNLSEAIRMLVDQALSAETKRD